MWLKLKTSKKCMQEIIITYSLQTVGWLTESRYFNYNSKHSNSQQSYEGDGYNWNFHGCFKYNMPLTNKTVKRLVLWNYKQSWCCLPSARDTLTTLEVWIKTLGVEIHFSLQPHTFHHTPHLSLYPSPLDPQYWAWPLTLTRYMPILQRYLPSKWDENVN